MSVALYPAQTVSMPPRRSWDPPRGMRNGRETHSFVQLTRGGDPFRLRTIDLGEGRIHLQEYNSGAQVRTAHKLGRLLIGVLTKRPANVMLRGRPWPLGCVAVIRDFGIDVCALGPSSFVWFDTRAEYVASELARLGIHELSDAILRADPAVLTRLGEIGLMAGGDGTFPPTAEARTLPRAIAEILRHSTRKSTSLKERAADARYLQVQLIEEFMWQHLDEPLTLAMLAHAASCNVRSLVYAFKRSFGLGPLTYFKLQRLNAVRNRLAAGLPTSILDAAADYGFWHMGHFSADYRTLFGVSPSQTRSAAMGVSNFPRGWPGFRSKGYKGSTYA
jgi:AraC-like DNA-binding protein